MACVRVATGDGRRVGDTVGDGDRRDVCRSWTDKAASWQRSDHCTLLYATKTQTDLDRQDTQSTLITPFTTRQPH